ncbi:MAG: 5-methyltetrahydropteroyltriglutamate--homocysteine S-methyltransferase, partial [Acidimicrobiia bacterium]
MSDSPPFRADHVGSFLRPASVREARQARAENQLSADELRSVEDEAIGELVEREESTGLRGITDGEYRRRFFHTDFLEQLDGVTVTEGQFLATFRKDDGTEIGFKPPTMQVTEPIRHSNSIQGADFDYLASVTSRTPKVSIPSPSMLHFRGGREAISQDVYPDLDAFFDDLTAAYREEIADLAARGCTYLQMDDTNLAYLCDPEIRERTAARGDDPDELTRLYCKLVNDSIRDRPDEMTLAIHLCRGNYRSA